MSLCSTSGATVTVTPLTTAAMAAAQADARKRLEGLEAQAKERKEVGLPLDRLPDLSDEGAREGQYQALLIHALAARYTTAWSGIEGSDGRVYSCGHYGRYARIATLFIGVSATSSDARAAEDFGPVKAMQFDAKKAALGKRLFFDKRLSSDVAISCATCHDPAKGFSDGLALSKAYPGSEGFRNTPTLINTAYKAAWFHDGRLGTNLNDVTREMITETYMMNMDMRLMQERPKQDPVYVQMFKDAGYGEPSNGSVRKAIPEYLKTLSSRGSPFDKKTMSAAAKRGFDLFKGKAGCAACHSGPRFTDDRPHNTGVPNNPDIWSDPRRHVTFVTYAMFMGLENYFNIRRDPGAHVRTHKADGSDVGKFMTPTLV